MAKTLTHPRHLRSRPASRKATQKSARRRTRTKPKNKACVVTPLAKAGDVTNSYSSGNQDLYHGEALSAYRDAYQTSPWVRTCISRVALSCSKKWEIEGIGGELSDEQVATVEAFLNAPNDRDTGESFLRRIVLNVLVYGFVVLLVDAAADPDSISKALNTAFNPQRSGVPEVLEPFSQEIQDLVGEQISTLAIPKSVTVLPSWQMSIETDVNGSPTKYEQDLGQNRVTYTPQQVIHITHPDSDNPIYGTSVIAPIARMALIDALIDKRQKSVLEDDTSIDSLFVLAETDEENARAVAAGISTQYRQNGIAEGAQRFLVTTSAVQYQDISKSKDGDYLGLKQWVRDEICLALGVPLTVLGVTQGTSLSGAGSDNHLRNFVENTVRPFAVYIEAQLNKQLLSRWNAVGINALLKLILEDTDDQAALEQTWDLCIRNGTMTPNEVRALRHMDPVQGGDTAFVTVGAAATPLDQLEAAAVASIDAKSQPPPTPAPAIIAQAHAALKALRKAA